MLRYATWYPPVRERWTTAAAAESLWRWDDAWEWRSDDSCRRPSEALEHHPADDGMVLHLEVEQSSPGPVLMARYCWLGPRIPRTRWTEDQRLSWEEFAAGAPCRGCGRGFTGGPAWKPIMQRTPGEADTYGHLLDGRRSEMARELDAVLG